MDRLSVIWKSNLSDKLKRNYRSCQCCYMDAPRGRWVSVWRKSLMAFAQECCELYCTNPFGNTPQNSSYAATYDPSRKPSKLDEPDMLKTAGEVRTNSKALYSSGPLHMDEQRLEDQLEPIHISSMPIQDVAWKTSQERWTIETGGERVLRRSLLPTRHDDANLLFIITTLVTFAHTYYYSMFFTRVGIDGFYWESY